MSNSTFFHNIFYAACILKSLLATFQLSSAPSLNLGRSYNGILANRLTHSHITKLWTRPKLKAFADDKLNVTKMIISVFDRVENFVGKGEIACTSNFSFSHNVFKRRLSQRRQKVSLCGNGLKYISRP